VPAPQIKTYILVVGRDQNDDPYRALAPYHVPMPRLTDNYEDMSNTELGRVRRAVEAELQLITEALADIRVEAERRLEAMK
jgi:hypothetical protein